MEHRLLAYIVRRGRPVAMVRLGAAGPVDAAVLAWRRALEERRADDLGAAAAELGRRVRGPLRPHLRGARTVLVAPDGALAYFPFAALPGERPGSYLLEDLAIGYAASGRHLAQSLAEPPGSPGRGLLAVGGVDYQADPGRARPAKRSAAAPLVVHRGGFAPLPGSRPEACAAADLFRAAFPGQPAEVLSGPAATAAEVARRLDGGRLWAVHLGTHGFFESPARVAALRDAVRGEASLTLLAGRGREDELAFVLTPLLRSGLVLAGGGRDPGAGPESLSAAAPPREDGILTAEEVQALDLRGTELVVLSACDTGLGELEYGQGVLGLQRTFRAAGAGAVVATLWKVDDAATGVLMERFYTNLWEKKLPKLEALRQAQLAILNDPGLVTRRGAGAPGRGIGEAAEKLPEGGRVAPREGLAGLRADPRLWAAFVLSGDVR